MIYYLRIYLMLVFMSAFYFSCQQIQTSDQSGQFLITIEGEDGEVRPPLVVASEGETTFTWVPNTPIVYTFHVEKAGKFKLAARVFCAHGAADSFNVTLDAGTDGEIIHNWNNIRHSDTFLWDDWAISSRGDPEKERVVFDLEPGPHTISLMPREPGAIIDMLIITDNLAFSPGEEFSEKPVNDEIHQYYSFEAEEISITSPFYTMYHNRASQGICVTVPDDWNRYIFRIPEQGDYFVWCRAYAEKGNQNSYKVRINNGRAWNANLVEGEDFGEWVWVPLKHGRSTDPFKFEEGQNELWIKFREEGLKLDKILITGQADFIPTRPEFPFLSIDQPDAQGYSPPIPDPEMEERKIKE